MTDDERKVVDAMAIEGGSFVKALAQCFMLADAHNFVKLKAAFADYWWRYAARADERAKTLPL